MNETELEGNKMVFVDLIPFHALDCICECGYTKVEIVYQLQLILFIKVCKMIIILRSEFTSRIL